MIQLEALTKRFGEEVAVAGLRLELAPGELILTMTYVVVAFSILVQGLTIGRLVRRVAPMAPRVDEGEH